MTLGRGNCCPRLSNRSIYCEKRKKNYYFHSFNSRTNVLGKAFPSESFHSLTELQKIDSKVSGNREQWKCAQFSTIIFRVFPMKSWIWRSAFGDSLMKSLNIIDIFAFKSVATKEHSPISRVNYHLFQGGWCFFLVLCGMNVNGNSRSINHRHRNTNDFRIYFFGIFITWTENSTEHFHSHEKISRNKKPVPSLCTIFTIRPFYNKLSCPIFSSPNFFLLRFLFETFFCTYFLSFAALLRDHFSPLSTI